MNEKIIFSKINKLIATPEQLSSIEQEKNRRQDEKYSWMILSGLFFFVCLLGFYNRKASADTIKILVIDTGYSNNLPDLKVCPDGLKDFTGTGTVDTNGHGTNILGTLAKELKGIDYCVYIYKVYKGPEYLNTPYYMQALTLANYIPDLKFINYSSSGESSEVEEALVKILIKHKVTLVAAAGNDGKNLDEKCDVYPACHPNVISVGNIDKKGKRVKSSNYGTKITAWECGMDICILNRCFSGTSMSAAVHTSRLVKELIKK